MLCHFREVALGQGQHLLGLSPPQLYTAARVIAVAYQQRRASAHCAKPALFNIQEPPIFADNDRALVLLTILLGSGLPGLASSFLSRHPLVFCRRCLLLQNTFVLVRRLFSRHLGGSLGALPPLFPDLRELGFANLASPR